MHLVQEVEVEVKRWTGQLGLYSVSPLYQLDCVVIPAQA